MSTVSGFILALPHNQHRATQYNTILRKSLEATLKMLAENGTRILKAELEREGTHILDIRYDLSLEKIMHAFKTELGQDVAEGLMEELLLRMEELWETSHPTAFKSAY